MDQRRQIRSNLWSNVLSLGVNVAAGLFYTPYLVRSLGIAAYGIVPLALIINQYIGVITGSLTGSLTRFYSVALQEHDTGKASKYLSSAVAAIATVVIGISPVFVLTVVHVDGIFNIPEEHVPAARALFAFTLVSFVLSLFSSLLNVTLYALNRLDLMNRVKNVRVCFRVVCTVLFFEAIQKDIAYIGLASLITEAVDLALSWYYFRRTTERRVTIGLRFFERAALVSMLSMTVWVMVHQLGDTGLYRIDNVMVNIFWSTRESGILGAVSEFGGYVMTIVSVIGTLFGPLILIAYAQGDHAAVKKMAMDNSQLVGTAAALIVGFLIGFAKPILALWLGPEYAEYSMWFILKQVTLPFYAAGGIYSFVFKAWNRVVFPAVFTLVIGIVNVLVTYMLCSLGQKTESAILMILFASAVCIVVQSYGLNAYCFRRIYPELAAASLVRVFVKIAFILSCTSAIAYSFTMVFELRNILELSAGMAAAAILCGTLVFYTMIGEADRTELLQYIRFAKSTG